MARQKIVSKLGKRIYNHRMLLGMTLRDLEAATGVSNAYICQLESGHARSATVDMVAKLAKGLGCSPCELAFGKQRKT